MSHRCCHCHCHVPFYVHRLVLTWNCEYSSQQERKHGMDKEEESNWHVLYRLSHFTRVCE